MAPKDNSNVMQREMNEEDANRPALPDGGWGWAVVFGSFMVHLINDGIVYSFGEFYADFIKVFDESKAYTAWIVSILVGVSLTVGPVSSIFVNKYGCRAVTIAGAIISSACIFLSALAQNVFTLIFTIGIGTGLGFGLIYLPSIVVVSIYFEKKRSLATGICVSGSGCGIFVFAPLIEFCIHEFGWRIAMVVLGGINLTCIIFGALFRPLNIPGIDSPIDNIGSIRRVHNEEKTPCCGYCSWETFKSVLDYTLLKNIIFLIFALSNFFTSWGLNVPFIFIVPQAEILNIARPSLLLQVIGIANTVGRLLLGWLCDRPWVNRFWVYNWCLIMCGVASALCSLCPNFWSLAICGAVFGCTIGAYVGLTSVITVDLLGLDKLTDAFGLLMLFQGIATFIGAPIAGWLYDITFSYGPGFITAGVVIAFSGAIMFLILPVKRYQKKKMLNN